MQLDSQTFLRLCEEAGRLAAFDLEATGLNGDYNSVLVVSIKPFGKRPVLFTVDQPGDDRLVVQAAAAALAEYDCWVSYYGKGFDVKMLQARLLVHGLAPLKKKPHVDMYYHLNAHVNTSRRSQAHRLEWLKLPEKKMTLSPDEWNRVLADPKAGLKVMEQRCASDTRGLEALYRRTKHLIVEVTR